MTCFHACVHIQCNIMYESLYEKSVRNDFQALMPPIWDSVMSEGLSLLAMLLGLVPTTDLPNSVQGMPATQAF